MNGPTARDRVHHALTEIGCATGELRSAAKALDAALINGGFDPAIAERLSMLADQLLAASDMVRGFGVTLADVDAALRGARTPTGDDRG